MDTREKLRAFNTLQDERFVEPDLSLLKKKSPESQALNIHAGASKRSREVLFALLDVATVDEIKKAREGLAKQLASESRKDNPKIEAEEIRKFLDDRNVEYHPKLGITKLRILKDKVIMDETTAFLDEHEVEYDQKADLAQLLELKAKTEAELKAQDQDTGAENPDDDEEDPDAKETEESKGDGDGEPASKKKDEVASDPEEEGAVDEKKNQDPASKKNKSTQE